MRLLLEERNFQVVCVEDGDQAIEKVRESEFDIIFMDIQMPRVDGLQATRRIRLMERDMLRAPSLIVALTAQAFDEDRKQCLEAGMSQFMAKPIVAAELDNVLRKVKS